MERRSADPVVLLLRNEDFSRGTRIRIGSAKIFIPILSSEARRASLRPTDGGAALFFWLLFFVAVDKEK
jgi:hypothetical protein